MNYLIVSLVLFTTSAWAQDEVLFADSPHRSVSRTRQVLDAADLRVLLPLGYVHTSERGALDGRMGVVENRLYQKSIASVIGSEQYVVELAIINGVSGGYEFAIKGHLERGERRLNNPDLSGIHREFLSLLRQNKPKRGDQPERLTRCFASGILRPTAHWPYSRPCNTTPLNSKRRRAGRNTRRYLNSCRIGTLSYLG